MKTKIEFRQEVHSGMIVEFYLKNKIKDGVIYVKKTNKLFLALGIKNKALFGEHIDCFERTSRIISSMDYFEGATFINSDPFIFLMNEKNTIVINL